MTEKPKVLEVPAITDLEEYTNHQMLFPEAPKDPLEVLWELIHMAHHMRQSGRQPLQWVRAELDFLVRQMCPFDGRVDQHEDDDHRFVPARR